MLCEALSHIIDAIENRHLPGTPAAISKSLAVTRALHVVLDSPGPCTLERALAELDVTALVDGDGWPQIRFTLGDQAKVPSGGGE